MLLTLPWFGSIFLGRVDLVNGEGVDERTARFSLKSFWKQVSIVTEWKWLMNEQTDCFLWNCENIHYFTPIFAGCIILPWCDLRSYHYAYHYHPLFVRDTQAHTTHTLTPPHPHSVAQGADWHWGPAREPVMTNSSSGQDDYVRNSSLATFILASLFLIIFLVFQVSTHFKHV